MRIPAGEHKKVLKGWGYEIWIVNGEKYCGKILHINEEKKCSWHYHVRKDETFYVTSGVMKLVYGYNKNRSDAQEVILNVGDSFHIPIGLIHQMTAIDGDLEFFEFSTQHFDSDSIRVELGD